MQVFAFIVAAAVFVACTRVTQFFVQPRALMVCAIVVILSCAVAGITDSGELVFEAMLCSLIITGPACWYHSRGLSKRRYRVMVTASFLITFAVCEIVLGPVLRRAKSFGRTWDAQQRGNEVERGHEVERGQVQ